MAHNRHIHCRLFKHVLQRFWFIQIMIHIFSPWYHCHSHLGADGKVWAHVPLLKLLSHRKDLCGCIVWPSSTKLGVIRYFLAWSRQKWGEVEVHEDEVLVSRFHLHLGYSQVSHCITLGEPQFCQYFMLRSLIGFKNKFPRGSTELVKSTDCLCRDITVFFLLKS